MKKLLIVLMTITFSVFAQANDKVTYDFETSNWKQSIETVNAKTKLEKGTLDLPGEVEQTYRYFKDINGLNMLVKYTFVNQELMVGTYFDVNPDIEKLLNAFSKFTEEFKKDYIFEKREYKARLPYYQWEARKLTDSKEIEKHFRKKDIDITDYYHNDNTRIKIKLSWTYDKKMPCITVYFVDRENYYYYFYQVVYGHIFTRRNNTDN